MIRRREFISLLGGAAVAWPLAAHAQGPRVVGFLHMTTPSEETRLGFIQGLSEVGYVEGQNLAIVYRFAEGRFERLPALAGDLVQRGVDVIAAVGGSVATQAAKLATATIPIVFIMGDADPVEAGFVASLGRPDRNITGISLLGGALGPKRVEILREIVPQAKVIAALVNPDNQNSEPHAREVEAAIRAAGRQALIVRAASSSEFDKAFALLLEQKADALIVTADITRARRPN